MPMWELHISLLCLTRVWQARSRPRAFQVLMMHGVGKCVISACAWILPKIQASFPSPCPAQLWQAVCSYKEFAMAQMADHSAPELAGTGAEKRFNIVCQMLS